MTSEIVLYGGIIAMMVVMGLIGYIIARRRRSRAHDSHVMNKITDFYATQDKRNKEPNINY